MIEIGFCLSTFGSRYIELREAATLIESLDFASIHVWDHYVAWPDPQESVLEAWTTLAGLADATERVRIGPLVANNLNRHPAAWRWWQLLYISFWADAVTWRLAQVPGERSNSPSESRPGRQKNGSLV